MLTNSSVELTKEPPFADPGGHYARFQGFTATASAGVSTNLDFKLTATRKLDAIRLILSGQAFGDSVDLQVVDVDLLLQASYGALPGYPVMNTFGTAWNVASDYQTQPDVQSNFPATISAGLYLRLVYHSVGAVPVKVALNCFFYQVPPP